MVDGSKVREICIVSQDLSLVLCPRIEANADEITCELLQDDESVSTIKIGIGHMGGR